MGNDVISQPSLLGLWTELRFLFMHQADHLCR